LYYSSSSPSGLQAAARRAHAAKAIRKGIAINQAPYIDFSGEIRIM
jgi:hypothetical protein